MTRTMLIGLVGLLTATAAPAQADWGFSVGYNRPVYRSCAPVVYTSCAPVVTYTSCAPVYYSDCAPVVTTYRPAVRYVAPARSYYAPRAGVSFYYRDRDRDHGRRFGYVGVRGRDGRSAGFVYRGRR